MKKEIGIGTLALIFILIVMSYCIGINCSQSKEYMGEYKVYTICPGDTLWSIASDIKGDTRYIVNTIKNDNRINDCGQLQIGQKILLRKEY